MSPRSQITKRIQRFLSWLTKLSLGSLFVGILSVLVATAIVVRTDFFQSFLRDKVVEVSQDNFDILITYQKAEPRLFGLFPSIRFEQVVIEDPKNNVRVPIQEVEIEISLFLSTLSLLFDRIYISEAKVRGLDYRLDKLSVFDDWSGRIRPESTSGGPRFDTRINRIRFEDFALDVDLPASTRLNSAFTSQLLLQALDVDIDTDEVEINGELVFYQLQIGNYHLPSGTLRLNEAFILEDLVSVGSLELQNSLDLIRLQGEIKNFKKPNLDIQIDAQARLQEVLRIPDLQGSLNFNGSISGSLENPIGNAELEIDRLTYKSKTFDKVSASLNSNGQQLKFSKISLLSSEESINGGADLNFDQDRSFTADLKFSSLSLPSYLNLIEPSLGKWKGELNGDIRIGGRLEGGRLDEINLTTQLQQFQISHGSTGDAILQIPEGRLNLEGQAEVQSGIASVRLSTPVSEWGGGLQWDDKNFEVRWDVIFQRGFLGRLFEFDLDIEGQAKGYYGGPFREMVMEVEPDFQHIQLNQVALKNLEGKLEFVDRRLFGSPLKGDGFEVTGGLFFPKATGARTLFSDFEFSFRDMPLRDVLESLQVTQDWAKPQATMSGAGRLTEWIGRPRGEGRLSATDFGFENSLTQGRLAKTNWRFDSGVFYTDDIFIQTSEQAGGVLGDMSFVISGINSLNLSAKQARASDLMLMMGLSSGFQSKLDFTARYQRNGNSIFLQGDLYESLIGTQPQAPSRFELSFRDERWSGFGSFLGRQIEAVVEPRGDRTLSVELEKIDLSLGEVFRFLNRRDLNWRLEGVGLCDLKWNQDREFFSAYRYFVNFPDQMNCSSQLKPSRILRRATKIYDVSAFDLEAKYSSEDGLRFESQEAAFSQQNKRLSISGWFKNFKDLQLEIQGNTSLTSASYVLPWLSRSEGELSVNGVWSASGYNGSLVLSESRLLLEKSPIVIDQVVANIQARNSVFELVQLRGQIQQGSIEAFGRFELDGIEISHANLSMQLDGPLFEPQSGVRFRLSGPLRLELNDGVGLVSGQLNLTDASFRRRFNLRGDLLKVFQGRQERFEFFQEEENYWDDWRLKIGIQSESPVTVRNNVVDADLVMRLTTLGTIRKPRLEGTLIIQRGRFRYFNQDFEVSSGSIQFEDDERNIPRYEIRAQTEIDDYRVFLEVEGSDQDQKILYSSEPPLSEKEILALVSYGTPPTEDRVIKDEDATVSAAFTGLSFVTGGLQDTIEGALASDLGISRFNLAPAFFEDTGRTELQLTLGTDLIRNRVLLNYSNFLSASGGHEIELDFRLTRNISLVGSWQDATSIEEDSFSGDIGGDLLFRFEFE